ncbi:MAG: tetratricopeptide repeat protein [Acidobacteriota bacterium]
MKKEEARKQFANLLAGDEANFELDRASLLIAAEEYPALNIEDYIAQFDRLASTAQSRFATNDDLGVRLLKLRDFLFSEIGFSGNQEDYFDARNSFLSDVLDRRTGIPITLSVVFIEVARRVELPLVGVGMPGHFVVKCDAIERLILLDPFHGGRELTEDDCREMISKMYGQTLSFHPAFLRAVTKRQILTRMLQNLKGIYSRARDHHRLLGAVERSLLLNPGDATEVRDRGLAWMGIGKYGRALGDLEEYLTRVPAAGDRSEIRKRVGELRQRQAGFN